jgi:site-specific DNA-adenine methylase
MFSYYGSKSKIVDYYPPPKYNKIIEPFAGSARYSLKYWQNDVLLVDKYPVIVDVWNYLKNASEQDILKLPILKKGDDVRKFGLTKDEMLLLGFSCQAGVSTPNYTTSKLGEQNSKTFLKNIASQLHKIRHWEIKLLSYDELENKECTWFIDPPYQFGGHKYKHSNKTIDFNNLSEWCKSRNGQAIVCENTKADWLPFKGVVDLVGTVKIKTTEAIWSNHKTNYDNQQLTIFDTP